MFKAILSRPIVVVMVCLWLMGVFASILTGDIDVVTWISEHRIFLGLIVAWVVLKYSTPLKSIK